MILLWRFYHGYKPVSAERMRPFLETINVSGASCALLERQLDEGIPFQWHHHPEFELTLTMGSRGHRYIGDSIEQYGDNDLVLVAPNVAHSWASRARLDGGRILVSLLPMRLAWQYSRLEPYGMLIVIFLMATGALWTLMAPLMDMGGAVVRLFL